MKLRYAFLLGIGVTALLTAFLFLPISFQIQEPIPVAAAKAATISLVDRIAVEHSTKETTPAREEVLKDERSVPPIPQPKNLPMQEETEAKLKQKNLWFSRLRSRQQQNRQKKTHQCLSMGTILLSQLP